MYDWDRDRRSFLKRRSGSTTVYEIWYSRVYFLSLLASRPCSRPPITSMSQKIEIKRNFIHDSRYEKVSQAWYFLNWTSWFVSFVRFVSFVTITFSSTLLNKCHQSFQCEVEISYPSLSLANHVLQHNSWLDFSSALPLWLQISGFQNWPSNRTYWIWL